MSNVEIKTDTQIEWYDLMQNEEVHAAYQSIKEVDDMVETINIFGDLTLEEELIILYDKKF